MCQLLRDLICHNTIFRVGVVPERTGTEEAEAAREQRPRPARLRAPQNKRGRTGKQSLHKGEAVKVKIMWCFL